MEEKYERYGIDWQNEVMKNPKMFIVQMLRRVAMERDDLQAAQLRVQADGGYCTCKSPGSEYHNGSAWICTYCHRPRR
jgi:hypothetical protein